MDFSHDSPVLKKLSFCAWLIVGLYVCLLVAQCTKKDYAELYAAGDMLTFSSANREQYRDNLDTLLKNKGFVPGQQANIFPFPVGVQNANQINYPYRGTGGECKNIYVNASYSPFSNPGQGHWILTVSYQYSGYLFQRERIDTVARSLMTEFSAFNQAQKKLFE
jgi:hypothetical protein